MNGGEITTIKCPNCNHNRAKFIKTSLTTYGHHCQSTNYEYVCEKCKCDFFEQDGTIQKG